MPTHQRGRPGEKPDGRRDKNKPKGPSHEWLFGRNAVREALDGRRRHQLLIFAEGIRWDTRLQSMRSRAESLGVPVKTEPRQSLDEIVADGRHQGVALRTSPYPYVDFRDMEFGAGPLLLLDHLQDLQNVGTLLRSAEAFGADGVIIPKDRAGEITPAVVNASAGAVEHLHIARVTNLSRTIDELKDAGYWIAGLACAATAQSLETFELPERLALVVGAEGKGLSESVSSRCDYLLCIDQIGRIDSLNAAIAGSIALFHLTRNRRTPQSASPGETPS